MDPLSITTTVISLTVRCTSTAFELYNVFQTLSQAPDTLSDLIEETTILSGSLRQVEKVLKRNPDVLLSSELTETFNIAVKGCRATLGCLEEEFAKFKGRADWKARIQLVWKESKMTALLVRLGRKKSTLGLLLQSLNSYVSPTFLRFTLNLIDRSGLTAEGRTWAQADRACLEQANADTISLINEYPHQRELILEAVKKETADSIRETCDSILSDTKFVFDDEIVTSKVYRLALAQAMRKAHTQTTLTPLGGEQDDAFNDVTLLQVRSATEVAPLAPVDNDPEASEMSSNAGASEAFEPEALEVQVVESNSSVFRQQDSAMLRSMHTVAETHCKQGRWKEAGALEVLVVRANKRVFGQEGPATLRTMHTLALTHYMQGRWNEAEALGVQVVEARKRVLGNEDPATLDSMYNLALTYYMQGRWKRAEALGVQVVEAWKRVLGREDPATLDSMYNLALTYRAQGRWKEAEILEVRVVQGRKRVLGQHNPATLRSIYNLALTYYMQGRWKEAETLGVQVFEARKKVLGNKDPATLDSMYNLALTYYMQGRWKEAEALGVQVVEAWKRVLGQEDPATLDSMYNLALTYRAQGRWKEAVVLEVQVGKARKRVLG
jgi:tetratricopeptide (TPR) repeat protein